MEFQRLEQCSRVLLPRSNRAPDSGRNSKTAQFFVIKWRILFWGLYNFKMPRFRFLFLLSIFGFFIPAWSEVEVSPMPRVFSPLSWQVNASGVEGYFPGSKLKDLNSWFSLKGWGKEKFRQGYGNAYCQDCEFTIGSIGQQITSVEIRKESRTTDDLESVFDNFESSIVAEIGGPSKSHGTKGKHVYYREWKRGGYFLRLTMETNGFSDSLHWVTLTIQRTAKTS
jgi:hypothetical protein